MRHIKRTVLIIILILLGLAVVYAILAYRSAPQEVTYGMSFSKFRTTELNLPFEETYEAILDELGVRNFRFSAHWPNTEPQDDVFNFAELDYQMELAEDRGASVVFAVGRRLPRWPECHEPSWIQGKSVEERNAEVLEYIEVVVNRYKEYENILYWQVENEPFLALFAYEHCGELDVEFLKEEIALIKRLDPERPILVTDSGNLGLWYQPWRLGDAFGTSLYRYFWNPELGTFKSQIPASFYRVKHNIIALLFGRQDALLIELSMEPWLTQPIVDTPIDIQLERMNLEKMEEIVAFAEKTRFERQYLWGAEWWYWMKQQGHPELWEFGKQLLDDKR